VREFLAGDPLVALGHALSGPATLAAFELGSERVGIPLESGEQEDEQDCFSDNTHRDIASDIAGIARVLEGNGDTPGLLVAVGGKPAAEVREHLGRLLNLVPRIPAPIDAVLVSPQEDPRRRILEALVGELIGLAGAIQRAGTAAGARVVIGGG
jgi:putative iron-regulated protein